DPRIRLLFPNVQEVEADYYRATRVFPVMRVLAIKRELYETNRWIARSLYDAFEESRQRTMRDIDETASLRSRVAWLAAEVRRTQEIMGRDYWKYGIDN